MYPPIDHDLIAAFRFQIQILWRRGACQSRENPARVFGGVVSRRRSAERNPVRLRQVSEQAANVADDSGFGSHSVNGDLGLVARGKLHAPGAEVAVGALAGQV